MPRYVGLLRAVNVGGRKLPMTDLRTLAAELGAKDVQTYVQSGNVVFTASRAVAEQLASAVTKHCGFEVRVLLRTATELTTVLGGQPLEGPESTWHVTFLATKPAPDAVRAVDPSAYGADTFAVSGREVYLRTPDGYGRTKLNNTFWERKLKVDATTRNWRTVRTIAELAGSR